MLRARPSILVVDSASDANRSLLAFLTTHDFEPIPARDGETAANILEARSVECLVTELCTPQIDGRSLMRLARDRNPDVCCVVMTSAGSVDQAVEAMHEGAYDFQVRPLHFDKLLAVLKHGLAHQALASRVAELDGQLDDRLALDRLGGTSRAIQRVMEQVRSIAATRSTVLIEGGPGTGKGLVALAIHRNSPRRNGRFVTVSCTALGEGLLEGELFGHEPGTLTDASAFQRGQFEQAEGGTLFLDEIADMPPAVQVKLVRLLQDRSLERVGGSDPVKVDVRLIAATSRDLAVDVASGRFREDLFFRLNVVHIRVPELRERREDIPLLVHAFVRESNLKHGRKVQGVTRGVLERLTRHSWPGNVRELKSTIEGMVVFAAGRRPLDLSDLPDVVRKTGGEPQPLDVAVGMTVAGAERQLIEATLAHLNGDKPRAAAMLGIGLRTLYRKIQQYGLR